MDFRRASNGPKLKLAGSSFRTRSSALTRGKVGMTSETLQGKSRSECNKWKKHTCYVFEPTTICMNTMNFKVPFARRWVGSLRLRNNLNYPKKLSVTCVRSASPRNQPWRRTNNASTIRGWPYADLPVMGCAELARNNFIPDADC